MLWCKVRARVIVLKEGEREFQTWLHLIRWNNKTQRLLSK